MQAGFIFSLVFAILIAVFALKNGNNVTVDFLFAEIEVSQAIVIFVSAALGAIIVTILGLVRQVKLSLKIKEQSKKINSLESEKGTLENRISELLNEANKESVKCSNQVNLVADENSDFNDSEIMRIDATEENNAG